MDYEYATNANCRRFKSCLRLLDVFLVTYNVTATMLILTSELMFPIMYNFLPYFPPLFLSYILPVCSFFSFFLCNTSLLFHVSNSSLFSNEKKYVRRLSENRQNRLDQPTLVSSISRSYKTWPPAPTLQLAYWSQVNGFRLLSILYLITGSRLSFLTSLTWYMQWAYVWWAIFNFKPGFKL